MVVEKKEFSSGTSAKNNFDFLRLLFAFSVFIHHFGFLTNTPLCFYWPISSQMGVAGFFIISGFLITKSFYRSHSLKDYFVKRIKRIVPAYLFIVFACAFGLVIISKLSAADYFISNDFLKYLSANIFFLNFIQPTLPGVFTENAYPFVNGALWTIKVEIALYLSVPICAFLIRKIDAKWIFIILYLLSFGFIKWMSWLYDESGKEIYAIFSRQFFGQIVFFISGLFILFKFDLVQKRIKLLLPIAFGIVVIHHLQYTTITHLLYPISFAISIIGFAYHFKPLNNVAKYGDISYGMYLFHYPIIQFIVSTGMHKNHPIGTFILCLLLVALASFISWHLLEKKFLTQRSFIK